MLTNMRLRTAREWQYFIMHRLFVFHTCSALKIGRNGLSVAELGKWWGKVGSVVPRPTAPHSP